jgi:hypothetical protein
MLDINGDGFVSTSELNAAGCGTAAMRRHVMALCDTDHDGQV